MKSAFACIAAMLAVATLATEAPAAPDKGGAGRGGSSYVRQCFPRVVTKRLCISGRMVTCQYRVMRNCRLGPRRCNHPSVIIPCSPAKQL